MTYETYERLYSTATKALNTQLEINEKLKTENNEIRQCRCCEAKEQIEALEQLLIEYGGHLPGCAKQLGEKYPCRCGWDREKKAINKSEREMNMTERNKLDGKWLDEIILKLEIIYMMFNWKWDKPTKGTFTPTAHDIKTYIQETWVNYDCRIDSGGLSVGADDNGDPEINFSTGITFTYNNGDPCIY